MVAKTALWWIRRDLRLADNQALNTAMEHAERVVPVFILDPNILHSNYVGEKRLAFFYAGLRRLDDQLQQHGSKLIVREGNPKDQLAILRQDTGASAIFAESDYSPYARSRDARIAESLPLRLTGGLVAHPPDFIHKADGNPYTVFTPFSKAWKALPPPDFNLPPLNPSQLIRFDDALPETTAIPSSPSLPSPAPYQPGEDQAQRKLDDFLDGPIYQYADTRNLPGVDGTSSLSPYLRFGMLSARSAVAAAYHAIKTAPNPSARKGAETWLNELIWREFFIAVLYNFPHVRKRSFRDDLNEIAWVNDNADFTAWKNGQTGYPIVDAAMRQLRSTGWMHNRTRMISASFLVKHLLIDWRWGERWFMQHLIDGDPAANNGGWQWTAGTGTDAAPYFRIFNPILQSAKFDPDGVYIRQWVPELSDVPLEFLHKPWEMPAKVQSQSNCIISQDYPAPIVEHSWARQRVLGVYQQARASYSGTSNSDPR